jgi:hypothetical protein
MRRKIFYWFALVLRPHEPSPRQMTDFYIFSEPGRGDGFACGKPGWVATKLAISACGKPGSTNQPAFSP